MVRAVDDVSLSVEPGKTLGIVGESGSGKSVTALSAMRLLAESAEILPESRIALLGKDLTSYSEAQMRDVRGKDVSMIFQEPMTSLNPVYTVGAQVMEAILLHQHASKVEARRKTIDLFEEVGIPQPQRRIKDYPHQMSGGQKQRVMIAMALSCNPKLLIADEPTTALDVTIQAQILDILRRLRDQRRMSILFITHDLGVIAEIADDVAVMYEGKIVEKGPVLDIFANPTHPYTRGLLACRPRLESTFARLPTIDDFMDRATGEAITAAEGPTTEMTGGGRTRLLHPRSEIDALTGGGFAPGPRDTFVAEDTPPLLDVTDLKVHFPVRRGVMMRVVDHVRAVDGISFRVYRGQTLGLVGESGCGKTTTGRAILRLIEPTAGSVTFEGVAVGDVSGRKLRELRRRMQIIFQDPYSSLNPRMTVESMLTEPMMIHGIGRDKAERVDRAVALLKEVDLLPEHLRRYPHEFSGGQRQRLCIARALTVEPEFIICDEAVSALDVSVQAQALNLLNDLKERRGLTYIFISHDLSVVKFMADMMAVMNDGKIVEFGPSEAIYADPREAYTKKLIDATPRDDLASIRRRQEEREAAAIASV